MSSKTMRITTDELTTVADEGVARALDARKAAGVELSPEELAQVSGGVVMVKPAIGIINGRMIDLAKSVTNIAANVNVATIAR